MSENTIKAVIIDDNEDAITLLEIYLQAFNEIQVLESTTSPHKGLKLVKKLLPDIVFLDIDMPEMNGLELGQIIFDSELKTEVVFTTAHSQFAFNALSIKPLDYLVKPFGPSEIISVINRYKTKLKNEEFERRMDLFLRSSKATPKIKLPTKTGIILIEADDLMIAKSETSTSSRVFIKDGREELVSVSIPRLFELMESSNLIKVNRPSSIINLLYVKKIDRKRKKCLISCNSLHFEEDISRNTLAYFEKMDCFPIV